MFCSVTTADRKNTGQILAHLVEHFSVLVIRHVYTGSFQQLIFFLFGNEVGVFLGCKFGQGLEYLEYVGHPCRKNHFDFL